MDEGGGGLSGPRQNFIHRSTDGGLTWSAPISQGASFLGPGRSVGGGYSPGMYSTPVAAYWTDLGWGEPAVGPDGVVHYPYSARSATDPGNIFYVRSVDNGSTWSAPLQLNTDTTTRAQWSPSLSVNAEGTVFVSWYDERNTTTDALERFGRASSDNGATWGTEMAVSNVVFPKPLQPDPAFVSTRAGIYNRTAFSDNGNGQIAYHAWTDGRVSISGQPQQDVFFDKIDFGLPMPRIVTTLDDHDDGTCNSADCSLREAVNAANSSSSASFITFDPDLAGIIQLSGALPTLSSDLAIIGPGPHVLTVRRNTGGNYRIFTLSNGTPSGPTVSLVGLTVSNGLASSGGATANSGGGISNDRGSLDVRNCHIIGNSSDPGSSTDGGGIFNFDGTLVVNNSTFSGNNAYYGGGISNRRNSGGTASVTVTNTTFVGNSAPNGFGGAIFNQGNGTFGAPGTAVMTLTNCTLSDNSATNSYGGAIYTAGVQPGIGSMTLTNCTLNGNSATNGGIFIYQLGSGSAGMTLRNNIFRTGSTGANLVNSGGSVTSQGYNLSNDNGGGFLTGTADQINTEPQLGLLASNGGPTMTHALMSGSPAINTGNDALAPVRDQRGYARSGISDKGAFEFNGIPPSPPAIASVVSRKLHGGTPFDINLPLTGNPGVECRSGGAGNNYQVVVSFVNPVTYTGVSVSSGTGSISSSSGGGTNSVVVNLTGVTSAQTITITLTGVSDGGSTGDVNVPMGILVGDTNGNRTVNATDIGQTKAQSGQPVTASNFRTDVTASGGSINASDIGLVKSTSGTSLP